ncbi:TVP38/TMEM64 family protein [Fuchsiella alkaliacetigena]|uniref:TVP38/TMEM64 family protein n=1 Tax=Fuchsiella alkaliacetigena TaxID=957042 RepID=UPI00200B8CB9|nr:TVP38/TMEM64 family protein [Fuchsiella alkaliacetigena]MCK8825079.1 TVP38/TMEM64 family protein [Fuchsiella alkaliacetigena]
MSTEAKEKQNNKVLKLVVTGVIIIVIALLLRYIGVQKYINLDNVNRLQNWIQDFGIAAPIVYILIYIAACIFFLPGLPLGVLAGIAFPPVEAVIYASIASTLGATAAFLIGRYAARDLIEDWIKDKQHLNRIDQGVKDNGWRMLMITRLIPIFPFNLQNYAYGLTDIKLSTYFFVSWGCMLPGTIAYVLSASALAQGDGNIGRTFMYLAIAGVFFVIISLIPKWLEKSHGEIINEIK